MKRLLTPIILGVGLAAVSAHACLVSGVVACPNGQSAAGIVVYVEGVASTTTVAQGAYVLTLPTGGNYKVCVDESTVPAGLAVSGNNCVSLNVPSGSYFADINFTLKGPACETPPPPGPCWLTGGGTIDKTKGQPSYSFGGVVNPGCSPIAAGGGNWNVIDHTSGLHFQGQNIVVTDCKGVPTRSPKVTVNVIDFTGTGIISGIGGNPAETTPVIFVAQATDAAEPGAGKDMLYLKVMDATTSATLMLISNDPGTVSPVLISTGNLQIHQTGCD